MSTPRRRSGDRTLGQRLAAMTLFFGAPLVIVVAGVRWLA